MALLKPLKILWSVPRRNWLLILSSAASSWRAVVRCCAICHNLYRKRPTYRYAWPMIRYLPSCVVPELHWIVKSSYKKLLSPNVIDSAVLTLPRHIALLLLAVCLSFSCQQRTHDKTLHLSLGDNVRTMDPALTDDTISALVL